MAAVGARRFRRFSVIICAFFGSLLVGCDDGEQERIQRDLTARLEQVQQLSAEKDSLVQDVVANTRFVQAINAEMERVRRLPRGVGLISRSADEAPITVRAYRDSILVQIRALTARLDSSEAKLAARARAGTPNNNFGELVDQYRQTIVEMRGQLAAQRVELATLQQEVVNLRRQVQSVSEERDKYREQSAAIEERYLGEVEAANTVYFVAGSRSRLKERRIIEESGGGLFGRGKTLVPGRQLNAGDFTPLRRTVDVEITLPDPAKRYRMVSNHNPAYLEPVARDLTLSGTIRIVDPDRFWEPGRYLIIVER